MTQPNTLQTLYKKSAELTYLKKRKQIDKWLEMYLLRLDAKY